MLYSYSFLSVIVLPAIMNPLRDRIKELTRTIDDYFYDLSQALAGLKDKLHGEGPDSKARQSVQSLRQLYTDAQKLNWSAIKLRNWYLLKRPLEEVLFGYEELAQKLQDQTAVLEATRMLLTDYYPHYNSRGSCILPMILCLSASTFVWR